MQLFIPLLSLISSFYLAGCVHQSTVGSYDNSALIAAIDNSIVHPQDRDTVVYVRGDEIIYNGYLTPEANACVYALVDANKDLKTVHMNSRGGDVDLGMDLGDFIFDHKLDVRVDAMCGSSCANYVFPAGAKKYLGKHAVIAYHGGANSLMFDTSELDLLGEDERQQVQAGFEAYAAGIRARETAFFERMGVDGNIVLIGQLPKYDHLYEYQDRYDGWYYTPESWPKLGVDNVVLSDGVWEYRQVSDEFNLFPVTI